MNLFRARVVLRPRSTSDVLDLALPFCLSGARVLGVLWLATAVPVLALVWSARVLLGWRWPALWAALLPIALVLEGLFTTAAGELLFSAPGPGQARLVAGRSLRRLGPYLANLLVQGALITGASLALLAPIPATIHLYAREAVLLEQAGPLRALGRSRALVRNRAAGSFGLWVATLALLPLCALTAEVLGAALVTGVLQLGQPFGSLWRDGGSGFAVVGALVAVPVRAAARFLGYIDQRTRKEGWDLQLRLLEIARTVRGDRTEAA